MEGCCEDFKIVRYVFFLVTVVIDIVIELVAQGVYVGGTESGFFVSAVSIRYAKGTNDFVAYCVHYSAPDIL